MTGQATSHRVLAVYLEPTPYILDLISELQKQWMGEIDVLFVKENLSQNWGLMPDFQNTAILPGEFARSFSVIRSRLATGHYGIVHLAGWGHLLLLATMVLAWFHRTPVVAVESDTQLPLGLPLWKRWVKRLFYPLLFKLPSMFLPGGTRQSEYLSHYGVPGSRITVVQMTVDVAAISKYVDAVDPIRRMHIRHVLGLPEDAIVLLYVGRMVPCKGVSDLIEAFSGTSFSETKSVVLLLVGDGSLDEMVNQMIASDPSIHCPGRLSGDALLDAYAVSDVFILASRFESWGLVVNEAMAASLPVIVTDRVGCVDDLVQHGKTGLIVPAESPKALSEVMRKLVNDAGTCRSMARAARELIEGWTIENEARKVIHGWTGSR